MDQQRPPAPGSGFEVALVATGAAVIGAGVAVRLGAGLATVIAGGHVDGGLDIWLRTLARLVRGRPPAQAWGEHAAHLPTATTYWTATVLAFIAVTVVAGLLVWVWHRIDGRSRKRLRFGQDTQAREATPADVVPLVVDDIVPPAGRMLLGHLAGHRQLLATEDRNRHPLTGRAARRQGNRGSVALIGPTGSGKTALAASAIATWNGPVVAVSVKRDLYDATAAARARTGQVAVFDPGAATNLPTARWSPLRAVTTSSGALRTGRALAQAIPRSGVTNAEYWAKHGEKLLGAFLSVAGLAQLMPNADGTPGRPVSMEQLASWVTTMAIATDPIINDLVRRGLDPGQPLEVNLMARHASTTFTGVAKEDHKIRSSVYSTAVLALDPWLEPSVAHSATESSRMFYNADDHYKHEPQSIDLEWLMSGDEHHTNTLYLTASQPEFERLSPVLGGLLADLKDNVHAWDIAGRRLDKPLLFVIDEAGQLELGWLPAEVSTIAALGAFFVTCWQSLSQMQHRYTTLADAVLSGHRTKCFFAGIDDLATIRYLSGLLGHEYVTRWTTSHDVPTLFGGQHHGRRSVAESMQREEFAPANAVRQMYPGEAVLLHGTLPPIHLDAVRWWQEKRLAGLIPLDDNGNPTAPTKLATCPLSDRPAGEPAPAVDRATLESALAQLPEPADVATGGGSPPARSGQRPVNADQGRLFDGTVVAADPPAKHPLVERPDLEQVTTGRCYCCGQTLGPGEGTLDHQGGKTVIRCAPSCTDLQRNRRS